MTCTKQLPLAEPDGVCRAVYPPDGASLPNTLPVDVPDAEAPFAVQDIVEITFWLKVPASKTAELLLRYPCHTIVVSALHISADCSPQYSVAACLLQMSAS